MKVLNREGGKWKRQEGSNLKGKYVKNVKE